MTKIVTRDKATQDSGSLGAFHSTKKSGLKFRKFHMPRNRTVYSGCTDPTQATARLVIVLVSRKQKSSTGENNFVKYKGSFRSNRPKWPDRSRWNTLKAGPEYSGRTKPKWSVPFDVPTEIFGILGCQATFWEYGSGIDLITYELSISKIWNNTIV